MWVKKWEKYSKIFAFSIGKLIIFLTKGGNYSREETNRREEMIQGNTIYKFDLELRIHSTRGIRIQVFHRGLVSMASMGLADPINLERRVLEAIIFL